MTPAQQAQAFLMMWYTGAVLGVVYDLLGILRRGRLCAAADLLFGACCAAGICIAALHLECEAFRIYVFAAAASGIALEQVLIGTFIRRVIGIVRRKVKKRT